jgi:hypothetical protein
MATGVATFTITGGPNSPLTAIGAVGQVAPALFSISGNGSGIAAATAIRVNASNPTQQFPVTLFDCSTSPCQPVPVDVSVPVLYAGPQPQFAGLDQINVPLTLNLRGSGAANIVLKVDQHQANSVTVDVQ